MRSPSAGDRPPKAIHFSIVFLSHSLTHSLTHFYMCYPFIEVVYETDGIVDASTKLRWLVHLLLRTLVESCAVIGARNGNWVFSSENFVRLCPPQYWNNVVLGDSTPSNPHTTHTLTPTVVGWWHTSVRCCSCLIPADLFDTAHNVSKTSSFPPRRVEG